MVSPAMEPNGLAILVMVALLLCQLCPFGKTVFFVLGGFALFDKLVNDKVNGSLALPGSTNCVMNSLACCRCCLLRRRPPCMVADAAA